MANKVASGVTSSPKSPTGRKLLPVIVGSQLEEESNISLPGTPDGSVVATFGVRSVDIRNNSAGTPPVARGVHAPPLAARNPMEKYSPSNRKGRRNGKNDHIETERAISHVCDIVPGSLSASLPRRNPAPAGRSMSPPKKPLRMPTVSAAPVHSLSPTQTLVNKIETLRFKRGNMQHFEGIIESRSSWDASVQTSKIQSKNVHHCGPSAAYLHACEQQDYKHKADTRFREEKRIQKLVLNTSRQSELSQVAMQTKRNKRIEALCKALSHRLEETRNKNGGKIMRCLTKEFLERVIPSGEGDMTMDSSALDELIALVHSVVINTGSTTRDMTSDVAIADAAATATISESSTGSDAIVPGSRLAMQLPGYGMRKPRVTTKLANPWLKASAEPVSDQPWLSPSLVVAVPPGCSHAHLGLGMANPESLIRSTGPSEIVTSPDFHPKVANPNFKDLTNPLGEVDYGPSEKIHRALDDIFLAFKSECDTMTCLQMTEVERDGQLHATVAPLHPKALPSQSRGMEAKGGGASTTLSARFQEMKGTFASAGDSRPGTASNIISVTAVHVGNASITSDDALGMATAYNRYDNQEIPASASPKSAPGSGPSLDSPVRGKVAKVQSTTGIIRRNYTLPS